VLIEALLLSGMAPTGEAIGRHGGLVVFVPYGLPGETVRVRLVEQKRSFARGEIVARLAGSPERVVPACPYFGVCGGCDWQHAAYEAQLRFKTAIVAEQLARIGKFEDPPVRPCIGSPTAYEYRNHVRLLVGANGEAGFRAARSHALVPVQDCPISEPALRRQIAGLQAVAGPQHPSGLAPGSELELRTWQQEIHVGAFAYRAGAGTFFQANTAVAARLVDAVLAALAPNGGEVVLDLYCGVGLFTVPIGRRVAQITGVEANALAAADGLHNLAQAGVAGRIVASDVAAALVGPEIAGVPWDAIVLDPPRTGVDSAALVALIALRAPKILYVSCEPATLARDLRQLADHGYHLAAAQPFDMFPQTRHVETLAVCELRP
jgi:23S rRNA (uracil1939-C5)-methyltransferase